MSASTKPNVILLVADDLGAWAAGRHSPEIVTPTLDALAAEGVVLDSFFCASPVCSPARASILTGRMPSAHGIHDWIRPEGLARAASPTPPFNPDFLEGLSGADTIPAMLKRSGYKCGMVGKWHIGSSGRPAEGYDYWYAHQVGGGPYYGAPIWELTDSVPDKQEPAPASEPTYFTDAVTRHALTFMEGVTVDQPFFLHVNWTAPHDPWFDNNHPEELRDLYADTEFPSIPHGDPHPWFDASRFKRAFRDRRGALTGYCAAVSGIDRSVDAILKSLDSKGVRDNTIVIFTSDNGFACGHHGIWGKGNATFPLNFWEPSIKVPFIIRWPARIAGSQVISTPASASSLYETLADLTRSHRLDDPLRSGRSIAKLFGLGGEGMPREMNDERVVICDEYGAARMIRVDGWKLVERRSGIHELFDLQEDPGEEINLAVSASHASRIKALSDELHGWFREYEDPKLSGWPTGVDGLGQSAPMWAPPRRGA